MCIILLQTHKQKITITQQMVYGILLESIVQSFILEKYDRKLLEQLEDYLQQSLTNINLFELYDDRLMIGAAEGMMSMKL